MIIQKKKLYASLLEINIKQELLNKAFVIVKLKNNEGLFWNKIYDPSDNKSDLGGYQVYYKRFPNYADHEDTLPKFFFLGSMINS